MADLPKSFSHAMVDTPGSNLCIFTGDKVVVHRGGVKMTSILPECCRHSVVRVRNEKIFGKMLEAIRVEFDNGNFATLFLNLARVDPIDEEDLQEFRATCLMIHDL